MVIVGAIVLVILLSFGYILVSPISVFLSFKFGDGVSGFAGVKLFTFEYKLFKDTTRKSVRTRTVEVDHKKSFTEKGRKALDSAVRVFHVAANEFKLLQNITVNLLKLLKGILKSPDQYYLKVSMAGGLGPPDLTGQLYGTILSAQPVLGRSVSLAYRPDFLGDKMRGEVVAGAKVRACRLLSEILVFVWRLPKIRTLRLYLQLKKGG
jgi:hypothetical protein